MRTLPHFSECGEFFLYLRPLCPNRQQGRRKTAQVREENPPLFAKTPLLSGKTCGLFAATRPPLTPLARHLPLSPPQRQDSPTFRTQNPRKIAQSCVNLDDSRLLAIENRVFLTSHPISSDCSAHTSLPKDCHLCQIATFLSYYDRKATGNAGLLTNIFYLCYLKCADLSSFFRPICRKPRCDSPRNDRLQTHYLYARTRAEGVCLPFPLRKIGFTLCQ